LQVEQKTLAGLLLVVEAERNGETADRQLVSLFSFDLYQNVIISLASYTFQFLGTNKIIDGY
jgi:hypothetical protein